MVRLAIVARLNLADLVCLDWYFADDKTIDIAPNLLLIVLITSAIIRNYNARR